MILATRINETFQVIQNFNSTNEKDHYICIDNKNTKKGADLTYRLVLTNAAIHIIKKLHSLNVKTYTNIYLEVLVRKYFSAVSQKINNKITPHGLRSIYRTTIEFLPQTQSVPNWIKEYSLSHETRNSIEKAYQRNDALKQRYFLQLEYSKFVFHILKDKELINIANKDLWWNE